MEPFRNDGSLNPDGFEPEALAALVQATQLAVAPGTRSLRCKPGHLLLALWPTLERFPDWFAAIESGLEPGCSPREIPPLIEASVRDTEFEQVFELREEDFDSHARAALVTCDRAENEFGDAIWEAAGEPVGLLPLWIAVLSNLGPEEREAFRGVFDPAASAAVLAGLLTRGEDAGPVLPPLFREDGSLAWERFDDAALAVLEACGERAGAFGAARVRPAHLLLALFERPDGIAEEVVRLQLGPGGNPQSVSEALASRLAGGPSSKPRHLGLNRAHLAETLQNVLEAAQSLAHRHQAPQIGERFLLRAALEAERDGVAGSALAGPLAGLHLETLLRDVDRRILEVRRQKVEEPSPPFSLPGVRSEDVTWMAAQGQLPPSVGQDALIEAMLRGLHRREDRHVLVTGEPGVGKTTLVRELGRRVAAGQVPFLQRRKVVLVDCDGVSAEESRERLVEILAAVKGRREVVLGLDHFEAVIRYAGSRESDNRSLLRAALRKGDLQLIAVIDNRHYVELLAGDRALLELFTRVEVGEVDAQQAAALIGRRTAADFEQRYAVRIEPRAIDLAARGAREFILSERLPAKAIRVLQSACEWLSFERAMGRDGGGVVTEREVVRALSQRTGIDEETIGGAGSKLDFAAEFSKHVVGQESAVRAVADRLMRIKAGASREGKPAAVFLFAGLTGTGKTELAKAVARVYSASQRLSVYPMTRFTQAHSIQGLTGVPPGYVGYEAGGRLINDLNADPYGVVLFDEAEKAHPDIWQSMLTLFDEAWIDDHRNVRAYGNRAIFILTSNAGQDFLRAHYRTVPPAELRDEVARRLVDYRNPETGLRPFSPEFLSRLTDVVIFNPLTADAMREIAWLQVGRLCEEWRARRGRRIRVDAAVIERIAVLSHAENERFGGVKGGRIVAQYVSREIEDPLLRMMTESPDDVRHAAELHVALGDPGETEVRLTPAGAAR